MGKGKGGSGGARRVRDARHGRDGPTWTARVVLAVCRFEAPRSLPLVHYVSGRDPQSWKVSSQPRVAPPGGNEVLSAKHGDLNSRIDVSASGRTRTRYFRFRTVWRTDNNVFILRCAIERARAGGKTLYVPYYGTFSWRT